MQNEHNRPADGASFQGWDKCGSSEALTLCTFKEAPKPSVIKINNILTKYFEIEIIWKYSWRAKYQNFQQRHDPTLHMHSSYTEPHPNPYSASTIASGLKADQ